MAGIRLFSIGLSETIKADHVQVDYINCNCFLVHSISAKMLVFLAKFTHNLDYERSLFFLVCRVERARHENDHACD